MAIIEGYMPFLKYQTYYRIVGSQYTEKAPLVLLHGGPGSGHNKFEVLDPLADLTQRQIIMYDQIGCGNSYLDHHPELWTMETWTNELIALLDYLKISKCHLLGQSWGGMLLLNYVCNCKDNKAISIILSSTLPASWLWGQEQHRMIKELPLEMQKAIETATSTKDYSSEEYKKAEAEFMLRHASSPAKPTDPECLRRPNKTGREAYVTGWGPNEFTPEGTLKDYDVTNQLKDIKQPALIISGGNDMCTPYIAKYMFDRIPNSHWQLYQNARHSCYVEENENYLQLVTQWLSDKQ